MLKKESAFLLLVAFSLVAGRRVERQANTAVDKWWENIPPETEETAHWSASLDHSGKSGSLNTHHAETTVPPPPPAKVEIAEHEYCDGPATKCVPYYLCNDRDVLVDFEGITSIRNNKALCSGYLQVCCRDISLNAPPEPPQDISTSCSGKRNIHGADVHISSLDVKETQFGEFPWMVAILSKEKIGNKEINLYVCGGSLIADDVILTAAHCLDGQHLDKLKVRVGEWDTQKENEIFKHQEAYVSEMYLHPGFNDRSLINNYALLILDRHLRLGPAINTICLPSVDQIFANRTNCFATGWGKDKFGQDGQFQHILNKVDLPIVPNRECQDALQTTRLSKFFLLDDSFMCAGGELGKDVCTGDGGSPLVCNLPGNGQDSTYYQVGIVSWGIGCGEEGIPGVYADVRKGLDWINSIIAVPL